MKPIAAGFGQHTLIGISIVFLATGCATQNAGIRQGESSRVTMSALGIFDDYNGILRGTGTIDPELDVQFHEFNVLVSDMRCVGQGCMTHTPIDSSYPDDCAGIRRISSVTCTDGRVVESEYHADASCLGAFFIDLLNAGTINFFIGIIRDHLL